MHSWIRTIGLEFAKFDLEYLVADAVEEISFNIELLGYESATLEMN